MPKRAVDGHAAGAGHKTQPDFCGCYFSSGIYARWAPELGFTPQSVYEKMKVLDAGITTSFNKGCGVCADCKEKPNVTRWEDGRPSRVVGVCVEPNFGTLHWLLRLRDSFNGSLWEWHVMWAAVHNSPTKYTSFPNCPSGFEKCALDGVGQSGGAWERVELVSIDDILEQYGLQYVDILKTDTEGFDFPALLSGLRSLATGRIGVYMFEYHELGVWPQHSLKQVVEVMSDLDYVCYFSGQPHVLLEGASLVRLTGCWDEQFEFHVWSNVVCLQRSHPLYPHTERLSSRYSLLKDKYYLA